MFAGKHRPGADPGLREAADRAFETPLALITEGQARGEVVAGDPEGSRWSRSPRPTASRRSPTTRCSATAAPRPRRGGAVERLVLGLRPR